MCHLKSSSKFTSRARYYFFPPKYNVHGESFRLQAARAWPRRIRERAQGNAAQRRIREATRWARAQRRESAQVCGAQVEAKRARGRLYKDAAGARALRAP